MASPVATGSESELNVSLHPLAILNASEHYTRSRLQEGRADVKVLGALLGTQIGRDVEILNTFELAWSTKDDKVEINHGFLDTRAKQFKQVFPTFEFLGWYSVGNTPGAEDIEVHSQILPYNESPLFLQLAPASVTHGKDLPVYIYEAVTEIVNNEPRTLFVRASYKVETGEAERIAVDHTAKPSGAESTAESALVANLRTQRNAIKMLYDRVQVIETYLKDVSTGKVPADLETLRQISALTSCIPTTDSPSFRQEYETEHDDGLLVITLASITKTLDASNRLLDKSLMAFERQGGGGGRPTRRMGKSEMF